MGNEEIEEKANLIVAVLLCQLVVLPLGGGGVVQLEVLHKYIMGSIGLVN